MECKAGTSVNFACLIVYGKTGGLEAGTLADETLAFWKVSWTMITGDKKFSCCRCAAL